MPRPQPLPPARAQIALLYPATTGTKVPYRDLALRLTGVRPKGAGGAAAPPRKNNSAYRNENRAIVSTEIGSLL